VAGVDVLRSAPNDLLRMWPVSMRVNKSGQGDDDSILIEPAAIARGQCVWLGPAQSQRDAVTRLAVFHELPSLDRRYCYIDACFLHRGCIDQRYYNLVVHEFGHPISVLLSAINFGFQWLAQREHPGKSGANRC